MGWKRVASGSGHPFYNRLNEVLDKAGFDKFCEAACAGFYHATLGRPSLAPGMYFRVMTVGFFEGLDSERGIAWRLADSLTLRQFLSIGLDENTPDHVTISRTRRLIDGETHQRIFTWVLEQLAQNALIKGKTNGVDSTTLEANAAMKSIVRRDTGENYNEYLKRLAEAEGLEASDAAALRRMDRKRKENIQRRLGEPERWRSGNHEAERRMHGAGLQGGERGGHGDRGHRGGNTHGGAAADTATIEETVTEAGVAVAELLTAEPPEGRYAVHPGGVEEVVADKGYHSNQAAVSLGELVARTYIAEPDRGTRDWDGKQAEKAAGTATGGASGESGASGCSGSVGRKSERNFAHQFDTGGMDRLYVRGIGNVH